MKGMGVQVSTVEVGIAGEQSVAEVAVSVRGAIFTPVLSVSVAHADTTGEAPELCLPSSGSRSGARCTSGVSQLSLQTSTKVAMPSCSSTPLERVFLSEGTCWAQSAQQSAEGSRRLNT